MLDRSDAAQTIRETLQQREAVAAHGCVVGVDHDLFEEGVDLRAQAREAAEDGDIVAGLQRVVGVVDGLLHRRVQIALGVFGEQRGVDRRRNRDVGFLQDIADALVGGGEGFGFRQLGEFADGFEAAVEVEEGAGGRVNPRARG